MEACKSFYGKFSLKCTSNPGSHELLIKVEETPTSWSCFLSLQRDFRSFTQHGITRNLRLITKGMRYLINDIIIWSTSQRKHRHKEQVTLGRVKCNRQTTAFDMVSAVTVCIMVGNDLTTSLKTLWSLSSVKALACTPRSHQVLSAWAVPSVSSKVGVL